MKLVWNVPNTIMQDLEIPPSQRSLVLEALKCIWENNFFPYEDTMYHQWRGTAMGTHMAPSYANLFMGLFEETYIWFEHAHKSKIVLYHRYIDDLFFLWNGSEAEAMEFVQELNSTDWCISFTPRFYTHEILLISQRKQTGHFYFFQKSRC